MYYLLKKNKLKITFDDYEKNKENKGLYDRGFMTFDEYVGHIEDFYKNRIEYHKRYDNEIKAEMARNIVSVYEDAYYLKKYIDCKRYASDLYKYSEWYRWPAQRSPAAEKIYKNASDEAHKLCDTYLRTSKTRLSPVDKGLEGSTKFDPNTPPEFMSDYYAHKRKGGSRRNKATPKDMTMKDIKELCKANQIKLSKVVDDKRVVYKKKELITRLKRKQLL